SRLYPLSLHDALPISTVADPQDDEAGGRALPLRRYGDRAVAAALVLEPPPRPTIRPTTIGRVEFRRRLWHMTPGLLAFLLPLVRSEEHTSELQSRFDL